MNALEFDKMRAELPILRRFIDFVNRQVGVYSDCVSSFRGNKVRIERQKARVQRQTGQRLENGRPVILYTSVEDEGAPDVIHHRIIKADDFIAANTEGGFNHQQTCWAIIVFLFAYWDEEVRPHIAAVRGVKTDEIKLDALGDLRILRHNIVHNAGTLPTAQFNKLKVMKALLKPDERIALTHDQMHKLFVYVKQAIATILLEHTGKLPGAPNASELIDIAIQNP